MPRPRLKLSKFERALIPNVVQTVRVDTSLKPETQGHYIWTTTQTSRNFLEANQQIPQTTYHICCIVWSPQKDLRPVLNDPKRPLTALLSKNGSHSMTPNMKHQVIDPLTSPYIQLDQPFQRVTEQKSP